LDAIELLPENLKCRRRVFARAVEIRGNIRRLHRLRRFFVSDSLPTVVGPNKAPTLEILCSKIHQEASFVAARVEVIQDLRSFDLANFGQCFQLDNNLFVANKIGAMKGPSVFCLYKTLAWPPNVREARI
jgi:hypothetical protein